MDAKFEDLVGKTLTVVEGKKGSEEIVFTATDGKRYILYHDQDCCESVMVEDICGDIADLVGSPILRAEETGGNTGEGSKPGEYAESWTWTFYNISTVKGSVTIRWLGESNGYYSESVDFRVEDIPTPPEATDATPTE